MKPPRQRAISHMGDAAPIAYDTGGQGQKAHRSWFRGAHTNFNPNVANMAAFNAVPDFVLHGWLPETPPISRDTNIVAFGSCFAENITKWLAKRDYSVLTAKDSAYGDTYVVRFGEGMVNSFVLRQQFEWALEGRDFSEHLWHGKSGETVDYDDTIRARTREVFLAADLFIITHGLSEIWYDKDSGDAFWRAVPEDQYDPDRHGFRVSSVEENRANLRAIHALIRKHRPDARILFTMSPVPLVATFRPVSCITANAASKAILRAALDEALRDLQPIDDKLHYWPSYEIVMDVFPDRWTPDRRHFREPILDYIMTLFETFWCEGAPQMDLRLAWLRAKAASNQLPARLLRLLDKGPEDRLRGFLKKIEAEFPADAALVEALLEEQLILT